jgi:acyl-CoA synthetase (AMP-forming)/AMP-acid ligase II
MTLLGSFVDHWADATPDAEALSFGDRSWTWAQWRERIQKAAGGLVAAGVRGGDRIAFLDRNHPSCLELTFAAASVGAAIAIVNWRLAPDELRYVLRDSGARLLFVGADHLAAVASGSADATAVQDLNFDRVIEVGDYESWLASCSPADPVEVDQDDVCLVLYSSGTTGRPKGVMLTHRNMVAHSVNTSAAFPYEPGDRNLVAMPLFHVGGTSYAILGIHGGVPTTLCREPDAASLFAALAQGATHAFVVPAVVAGVLAAGPPAVQGFGRLKQLGYGAAPMPLPLLREALAAWPGMRFVQVYGMTELCGVVSFLGPEAHRDTAHPERLLSAGTVQAGSELRLVDPATGEDAAAGAPGELWFRGEQRMLGYLGNPEATADAVTPDGWLRSGDIARLDDDGFIYIVDRLKDMIITGGENVYSPEVEQVLVEHPAVGEVAVIGVPDERWGEGIKAFVVPRAGEIVDGDQLIAFCRERLAHFKCPSSVEVVESLPRNPTGKVLKRDLRKPYWAGRSRQI